MGSTQLIHIEIIRFQSPFRGEIWVEKWQPESFKAPLGAKCGVCFAPKGAKSSRTKFLQNINAFAPGHPRADQF